MSTEMPNLPEIRQMLAQLRETYEVFKGEEVVTLGLPPSVRVLEQWIKQIEDQDRHSTQKFTIILLGEYNSGKSTFLNALLGLPTSHRLPTSDEPTNAKPIRLSYRKPNDPEAQWLLFNGTFENKSWAEAVREGVEKTKKRDDIREIILYIQNDILSQADIMDMPGTGAGWHEEHAEITRDYIANAEAVFWIIGDEPSHEGWKDIHVAREKGVRTVVVFNAWGFLEASRNEGLVNQDEIEESVHQNYEQVFKENKGFRVYSKKCLESQDLGIEVSKEFGLGDFKEYLFLQFLESFPDKADERRRNVRKQVCRIAEDILGQLSENQQKWDSKIEALSGEKETTQRDKEALNALEHSIRVDLRKLSEVHTERILTMMRKQVDVFIDEQIIAENLDLYKAIITPGGREKLQANLTATLKTKYLHLDQENNWFVHETKEFVEESWTALEAKWKRFLLDIPLEPEVSASTGVPLDLPFEQLRKAAMEGVTIILERLFAAGAIIGILLWIPGGEVIDAFAIGIYLLYAALADPMKKPRETAKRRFSNELEMQHSGIKNDFVRMIMEGSHKDLRVRFLGKIEKKTEILVQQESVLNRGGNSARRLSDTFDAILIDGRNNI